MTKKEFDKANERRRELIDKKYGGGLTDAESEELSELQISTRKWINKKFPLPWGKQEEVEKAIERIKKRHGDTS